MTFTTESAFEEAVIKMLSEHGWESAVLKTTRKSSLSKTGLTSCSKTTGT